MPCEDERCCRNWCKYRNLNLHSVSLHSIEPVWLGVLLRCALLMCLNKLALCKYALPHTWHELGLEERTSPVVHVLVALAEDFLLRLEDCIVSCLSNRLWEGGENCVVDSPKS